MSVIPNQTNINFTTAFFEPLGSGGGGSVMSSFQTLSASSFTVSTINGVVPGVSPTVSSFQMLSASSFTVSTINGVLPGATTASQTFQDQQTDGTPGGTSPGFIGAYGVRVLNTGIPALSGSNSTTITGMSLSSNQITCPAGTYTVAGSCPGIACGRHRCRLYNVTDSNVIVQGQNNFEYNGGYEGGATNLNGTFVLTGTKTIQLEHQVENSATLITAPDNVTLGLACGFGDTEVYSQITLTKIG